VLLSQGESIVASFAERYSDVAPGVKDATVVPPHITYSERMTLSLDGRTIELIHPGVAHSNGDTMIYLPEQKILFAGDILFNHIFPPVFGSSAGWIAAIERLEQMDIETIVPGHGYLATKKELVDLKECLIALRSQVKDCFDRNLTPEHATKEIDLPYLEWPRSERLAQDVSVIYEELGRELSG
jgi:cyclase